MLESVRRKSLDGGHQSSRTSGVIGDAKDAPLLELEESSLRFVRHSVRWYPWASVAPEPGVEG